MRNHGAIQVTRDMGLKEPITSSSPLQTGEIGDDFSYYFMLSEQVPSVVAVGVLIEEDNTVRSAGGYIIQLLPEATEEDIAYIEDKIKNTPPVSQLLDEGHTPEEILKKDEFKFLSMDINEKSHFTVYYVKKTSNL